MGVDPHADGTIRLRVSAHSPERRLDLREGRFLGLVWAGAVASPRLVRTFAHSLRNVCQLMLGVLRFQNWLDHFHSRCPFPCEPIDTNSTLAVERCRRKEVASGHSDGLSKPSSGTTGRTVRHGRCLRHNSAANHPGAASSHQTGGTKDTAGQRHKPKSNTQKVKTDPSRAGW